MANDPKKFSIGPKTITPISKFDKQEYTTGHYCYEYKNIITATLVSKFILN